MSAEVSFTKRAAAELSRCFNGLTTSVNRSSSKKSTTSTASTGAASSSTTSGVGSPSSLNTTSSGSLSDPAAAAAAATASSDRDASRSRSHSSASEVTYLLTSSPSSSSNASPSKKTLFGGQSTTCDQQQQQQHSSPCKKRLGSGSHAAISGPGNMIQNSVQTLITKANTTLSPFKESIHMNGEAAATVLSSKSSAGDVNASGGCSSKSQRTAHRAVATTTASPSTPSRRPSGPPPAAPRKTSIARRKNFMLNLEKPHSLEELSKDFPFLNHFFAKYFTPKERTVLSQVCSYWRDVLYNDPSYWGDLVMVINCNDLRRCSPLLIDSSSFHVSSSVSCNNNNNNNKSRIGNPSDKKILVLSGDDNIRSNIYLSMEQRGFDAVCLYGATDSDVIDFASRISTTFMRKIISASLRSSSVSDKGLEIFLAAMNQSLLRLELTGCNEITDSGLWTSLIPNLQSLSISDCINVADETVAAITQMLPALKELNLQAYHVTDAAMSYFGTTPARGSLRCLRLENCWEIGNQGVLNIAHGLPNLVTLSLSGCSKINDDAIEVIAEQLRHLTSLNLSWCSRISDASLEYIACDLADTLRELIIDRCVHVTDIGLGYAATMSRLSSLSIRWCPQIRDFGIQTLCSMKSLKSIALSGCPQLSVSGLSCLVQIASLTEIELTNCTGATPELIQYLKQHLPASTVVIE